MDAKEIGARLRELRGEKSQQQVADDLMIKRSSVGMYEAGGRIPRDEIKVKIANYYGLTVESIFYPNSERGEHMSMKAITEKEMERILQEEPDEEKVLEAVRRYRAQRNEDKDRICQLLGDTLKATREHMDLQGLYYQKLDSGDELVNVHWSDRCTRVVTVTADSGIAMIRDILQAIK